MPRLSLYRPEKGNDYKFLDREISEVFQVGGTDIYLHKYIGTNDGTTFKDITQIQDLVFLENRDRKYDDSIYRLRAVYNVQDLDFNLSQFGLFIDNDTVFMTVHINDFIRTVGRKPISGDVIEIPHLKDEFALSSFDVSLPRYYVISDVGRAAEGFSPTWYPHLYRLKLTKIADSQQFADIFTKPTDQDANFVGDYVEGTEYFTGQIVRYQGTLYEVKPGFVAPDGTMLSPSDDSAWSIYGGDTLRDLLSTQSRSLQINDAVLAEAENNAPKSGYETQHLYTLAVDERGNAALQTVDETDVSVDETSLDVSRIAQRPKRSGYAGYLLGDGIPLNGVDFGHGITFPNNPYEGDYFLRTDFFPNRLFRFDGSRWVRREDAVRTTMTSDDPTNLDSENRLTQKGTFINNKKRTGVNLLGSNTVTLATSTNQILTTIDYVSTMYATALIVNIAQIPVTVTNSAGKALLTFNESVAAGKQIDWKLYESSIEEKQALSKAVKPRADL